MRAISLHQPHASFIAWGFKPFETRHWSTNYRGPLLIHAAKRPLDKWDRLAAEEIFGKKWLEEHPLPFGAFVCKTSIIGVHDAPSLSENNFRRSNGLGDFGIGRFAWQLGLVWRFDKPIAAKGGRCFWNFELPGEVVTSQPWRLKP